MTRMSRAGLGLGKGCIVLFVAPWHSKIALWIWTGSFNQYFFWVFQLSDCIVAYSRKIQFFITRLVLRLLRDMFISRLGIRVPHFCHKNVVFWQTLLHAIDNNPCGWLALMCNERWNQKWARLRGCLEVALFSTANASGWRIFYQTIFASFLTWRFYSGLYIPR